MSYIGRLKEIGAGIIGRAVTDTLYVSPDGGNTNGRTWGGAFTTIQAALDAASTDAGDNTLIVIAPHATNYDINTAGDPTWSCNCILMGSHRTWAKIKNTAVGATSIMKLTGKASINDLNFNLGAGSGDGVIMTHSAGRAYHCQFVGEDLTGAATALHFQGAAKTKHHKIIDCNFLGDKTFMTGLLLQKACCSDIERVVIHHCKTGIQIVDADSDSNIFREVDIGDCTTGLDLDAGAGQHFLDMSFHDNDTNIDDAVASHDHIWQGINGQFPITVEPDNFVGVQVDCGGAEVFGGDTEIRAAATSTKPFRIVAIRLEPSASGKFRVRFSADSGASFFDAVFLEKNKREAAGFPSGTEFIFNTATRISASAKSESGGNNVKVWIEVQEI